MVQVSHSDPGTSAFSPTHGSPNTTGAFLEPPEAGVGDDITGDQSLPTLGGGVGLTVPTLAPPCVSLVKAPILKLIGAPECVLCTGDQIQDLRSPSPGSPGARYSFLMSPQVLVCIPLEGPDTVPPSAAHAHHTVHTRHTYSAFCTHTSHSTSHTYMSHTNTHATYHIYHAYTHTTHKHITHTTHTFTPLTQTPASH